LEVGIGLATSQGKFSCFKHRQSIEERWVRNELGEQILWKLKTQTHEGLKAEKNYKIINFNYKVIKTETVHT
jgi:hypothetical protein